MDDKTREALERLLKIAKTDTGQARRVAAFLLAWWNAGKCGGFDFTDAWGCDLEIKQDMLRVFAFVISNQRYPDTLGYGDDFKAIIGLWRAHLIEE